MTTVIVGDEHHGVVGIVRVRLDPRPQLTDDFIGVLDGRKVFGPVAIVSGMIHIG